ncbi:periplasmic heavy metal sensor [Falsirhodobacter halotolerans]|uniref:periplasmic heavy metal sensor n=1 Tax=Falsirhodobacter halotolerans TaxID=1146892 RepID=UPI001FD0009D|nr:periplasmic heavy metal sensor [Falsirhodobacter halotolerans]MCJ8140467.1 periplasmic heavy metal sensor [Falsirhodobacter halotolerans]
MITRLSPRALRIALGLSVALNLLVLGIVAGAILRDPPPPPRDRGFAFSPIEGALSPEDRREIRHAFRARARDFDIDWRDMRAEVDRIVALLRAEPYDPAAVELILNAQRERGIRIMALGQALVADHLAGMTPDQRQGFADRLEGQMKRPSKDGG